MSFKKLTFVLMVCLTFFSVSVYAESRYLPQKYVFDASGKLTSPLVADFGVQRKNVFIERTLITADKSLLLAAFPIDSENVFILKSTESRSYSVYKAKLRDNDREEVIILGLGPVNGKKIVLKEVYILAENDNAQVAVFRVKGFEETSVLNAPLQLNNNRSIVFPTEVGNKNLEIYWNPADGSFVANLSGVSNSVVASGTVNNNVVDNNTGNKSSSQTRDDSVFDEV